MFNFGVSAFLKVASLAPKPRLTELRKRLVVTSSAFDFHKRMRRLGTAHIRDGSAVDAAAVAAVINPAPERNAAEKALKKLDAWRASEPGAHFAPPTGSYKSPTGFFSISLRPDFGISRSTGTACFSLWNTQKPKLSSSAAYGTLHILSRVGFHHQYAIISLQDDKLFWLHEEPAAKLAADAMVDDMEASIRKIYEDEGLPLPPSEKKPPA